METIGGATHAIVIRMAARQDRADAQPKPPILAASDRSLPGAGPLISVKRRTSF
jgi:hypothetical protein